MALKKKGRYWYGTTTDDVCVEIIRYSKLNGYEAVAFSESACSCGSHNFKLESDEEEGAAKRICSSCGEVILMGDSEEYATDANFYDHVCVCDGEIFELVSGVALYQGSEDVRWYYIGCRCIECSLVGVFADWKCEAGNASAFLSKT
ncbi:MAG: hypothetical protein ACU837_00625 [Gammaproteobacteria bacterium]